MSTSWQSLERPEGTWLVYEADDWSRFAGQNWLDQIMSVEVRDRYHAKQGRSIGRWTLHDDSEKLVVYLKRHFELPASDALRANQAPEQLHSPGMQEWQHLRIVESFGMRVPRTVAAGELRRNDGSLQSFIALEELAGMLALHEAIPLAEKRLSASEFLQWKQGLFAEVAFLSWELHRRSYFHQDLYLCHFYILESDCEALPSTWRQRVVTIDFHRLTHGGFLSLLKRWKDLAQFWFSTYDVSGIAEADRWQFWDAYQRLARDFPPLKRALSRAMIYKAQRYHQHNLRTAV